MVIEGKIACRARVEDSGESAVFYNRKNGAPVKTRLFSAADVRESLLIAGAYGSMRWRSDVPGPRFAGAAARLRFSGVKPKRFKRFHLALDAVLGPIDDREAREIFEAFRRQRVNWRMIAVREHLPGKIGLDIQINGIHRLRQVLASGGGAILWANPFTAQTVIGKRGLWEAGLRPVQVSSMQHGIRNSVCGNAFLNPLLVEAENKYLLERLPIDDGNEPVIVRRVLRALNAGNPVIVANSTYAGSSFVEMQLGQAGFVRMPTTVPGLALRFGAPVFAMTTTEVEPHRAYRIDLAEITPMVTDNADLRSRNGHHYRRSVAGIAMAARDELLKRIIETPPQFQNWLSKWNSLLESVEGGVEGHDHR